MSEYATERPPWLSQVDAGCPVTVPQQVWIEASMSWFVDEFGREEVFDGIVLPGEGLRSGWYKGTPEQIDLLVAQACDVMSIDPALLTVELFEQPDEAAKERKRAVGHYYVRDGRAVIGLDRDETSDPAYLTAIIAHELSHVRLLGEGRVDPDRKDQERLTDLLTVFFGFGIFSTNAALSFGETGRGWSVEPMGYLDERMLNAARNDGASRLGYLSEPEFGYAMACYAWLRNETDPGWATDLDPGPRVHLKQGLAYLSGEAEPGGFPTRKSGPISIKVVPKGSRFPAGMFFLPKRGSAALRPDPPKPRD